MYKVDPLKGLNPNQSGPVEKIQNGDPKSGPNRDQRSGAAEAGGPGPSLQQGPTGTPEGQVPVHEGLVDVKNSNDLNSPVDLSAQEPAGSLDRAGMNPDTGVPYGDPTRKVEASPEATGEAEPDSGDGKGEDTTPKPKQIKKSDKDDAA